MNILFVTNVLLGSSYTDVFFKRTGFTSKTIKQSELSKVGDLASYLADFDAVIVETNPIRRTEKNKKLFDGAGLSETTTFDLLRNICNVFSEPVIAAIDPLYLHQDETLTLSELGVQTTLLHKESAALLKRSAILKILRGAIAPTEDSSQGQPPNVDLTTALSYDRKMGTLSHNGIKQTFTEKEASLLEHFWVNARIITKPELLEKFFPNAQSKIAEVFICKIRKKLGSLYPGSDIKQFPLVTTWGMGWNWAGPRPQNFMDMCKTELTKRATVNGTHASPQATDAPKEPTQPVAATEANKLVS